MKKRLFFIIIAAIALAACSNDKDNEDKGVILTGGTQTDQVVFADQTSGNNEGIKFTASEAWYASVSEMALRSGGSQAEWLSLNSYSGEAGEHTLFMTIKENHTGYDRKAEIKIVCGSTAITITVEQKCTTSSGEQPKPRKLVKLIKEEPYENTPTSISFEYDNSGRISRITETEEAYNNISTFSFSGNAITETEEGDVTNYTIGNSGYIETGSTTDSDENKTGLFTYTNGHLTKGSESYIYKGNLVTDITDYVWNGGKLLNSKVTYFDTGSGLQSTFEYQSENYDCKSNLVIYRLLDAGIGFHNLDYFGKDTDSLISKITSSGDRWNKDNGVREIRYEKNSDGYVIKIYGRWTPAGGTANNETLLYEISYY